MGIDIGSISAVGQIDPPWSVSSLVQRLGRSGRREGEPSIMRLYVREESPHRASKLTDLLFPDLLRGIALTQLMQQKWLEPTDVDRLHLSTFVHQVLSHLKQTGGMTAAKLYEALIVRGPFQTISTSDYTSLLRTLGERGLIEQISTGEIILAPDGEHITSAHDFYAAFKSAEMFTVRHEKTQIGELPFDALPPAGQVVVLAGKRWLVQDIDVVTKCVWVSPAKGGKTPLFLGNAGELHTRVVQEMKAVLMGSDEPPYIDIHAREILRAARHVARTVGLDKSSILLTASGLRWFPWVGTRCLRTFAILTELSGCVCETDRLSVLLPLHSESDFLDFLKSLLDSQIELSDLGAKVTPQEVEKFDEFLPKELLSRACALERLSLPEARRVVEGLLHPIRVA